MQQIDAAQQQARGQRIVQRYHEQRQVQPDHAHSDDDLAHGKQRQSGQRTAQASPGQASPGRTRQGF